MPMKVKRGLGLLVVAFAAWLVAYPSLQESSGWAMAISFVAGTVFVLALVGGLVLLAWGLLRD
jgi:hypothetical protein